MGSTCGLSYVNTMIGVGQMGNYQSAVKENLVSWSLLAVGLLIEY